MMIESIDFLSGLSGLFHCVVSFLDFQRKLLGHLGLEESTYLVIGALERSGFWVSICMLRENFVVLPNLLLLLCPISTMGKCDGKGIVV